MKRKLWVALMAAVCVGAVAFQVFGEIKIGQQAPLFALNDTQGKTYALEGYRGKQIVFLNFFATWCENCKEEMAQLKQIHEKYKDSGLAVISVNVQERPDKVKKFIEKFQLPFPVVLDQNAAVAKQYGLVGFPSNVIVDGDGKVRFVDARPPADMEKMMNELKPTLKSEKPAPAPGKKGKK